VDAVDLLSPVLQCTGGAMLSAAAVLHIRRQRRLSRTDDAPSALTRLPLSAVGLFLMSALFLAGGVHQLVQALS
jgi:hypothetical protein